jgi:hypothetical protein
MNDLLSRAATMLAELCPPDMRCLSCGRKRHRSDCFYGKWLRDLASQPRVMGVRIDEYLASRWQWVWQPDTDCTSCIPIHGFNSKEKAIADARRVAESLGLELVVEGDAK